MRRESPGTAAAAPRDKASAASPGMAGGVSASGARYQRLDPIATGGMGTVYLGRMRSLGGFERLVAIKRCHPHLRNDAEFRGMLLDEARIAARVRHPNVVPTLDVGDDADGLYIVMEYVEGGSLAELSERALEAGTRVPADIALRVMLDALAGLHAAHELRDASGRSLQLVHRDVSPQNVLVGTDGVGRLVDFGVARALVRATVTRDGQLKGKLGYMPPEQLASGVEIDRRADVYAAGVTLWEALTGKRLFGGDSVGEIVRKVLSEAPPAPSRVAPAEAEVSSALDAVVLRALAREPDARYATAADFAEALEACGAKVATARAVGAYVEQALGVVFARRRASVATAASGTAPAIELGPAAAAPAAVTRTAEIVLAPPDAGTWPNAAQTQPDVPVFEIAAPVARGRGRGASGVGVGLGLGALLATASALAVVALMRPNTAARSAPEQHVSAPVGASTNVAAVAAAAAAAAAERPTTTTTTTTAAAVMRATGAASAAIRRTGTSSVTDGAARVEPAARSTRPGRAAASRALAHTRPAPAHHAAPAVTTGHARARSGAPAASTEYHPGGV